MRLGFLLVIVGCGEHHAIPVDAPADTDIDAACTTTLTVAVTGDDAHDGVTASVRTVTHALALAETAPCPMVTINVGAGVFAEATGEAFPLATNRTGVTIAGTGMANTTIRNPPTAALVTLDHGLVLSNLHLVTYMPVDNSTMVHGVGEGHLSGVEVDGGMKGQPMVLDTGSHTVIDGGSTLVDAFRDYMHGALDMTDMTYVGDLPLGAGAVVHALRVTGSAGPLGNYGFLFNAPSPTSETSTLDDVTVTGYGYGVNVSGNWSVKIRNSHLSGNRAYGVFLMSAAQLDLGTAADSGNNVFNVSGSGANGNVGICNMSGVPLVADGDTFGHCPPVASDCYSPGDVGPNVQTPNCTAQ